MTNPLASPLATAADVRRSVFNQGERLILFRNRTSGDPDGDSQLVEIDIDGQGSGLVKSGWQKERRYPERGALPVPALKVFITRRTPSTVLVPVAGWALVSKERGTGLWRGYATLALSDGGVPYYADEIAFRWTGGQRISASDDGLYTAGDWAIVPEGEDSAALLLKSGGALLLKSGGRQLLKEAA